MDLSRRNILAAGAALAATASAAKAADFTPSTRFPDPAVESLDPRFAAFRVATSSVERVATGFRWAEGPVWMGDWGCMIFSDVQTNTLWRWDERSGRASVFRKPSNFSNGNARDRQGRLLTCEHLTNAVTRTEFDGSRTVLVDSFEGKPLNSPNDLVCKSDGTIWFTDPAFGPQFVEGSHAATQAAARVYRFDPATKRLTVLADNILGPNGLAFSPDESKLYVIESRALPNRNILAYNVVGGDKLGPRAVLLDAGTGATPDGLRVDINGNLWCGWGMGEGLDGVNVLAPDGKSIGRIRLPERCANLCFGGEQGNRLLMTASTSVYSLLTNTRGAKLL